MPRAKRYDHVPESFELVNQYKELVSNVTKNCFTFPRKFPLFLTTEVLFLLRRPKDLGWEFRVCRVCSG